eukprot:6508084-Ditylum_brightwellii.AAC.1
MEPTKVWSKGAICSPPDNSKQLGKDAAHKTQSIVGIFLYYSHAIDSNILPTLNKISTNQANPTENTTKECKMLMDYLDTYLNSIPHFFAGNM